MLKWPDKDPDELLDYEINWAARLDGDTIVGSTWIIPDGITQEPDFGAAFTGSATTIWLSGGILSEKYELTNRIETAGGRIMDQSALIRIRSK